MDALITFLFIAVLVVIVNFVLRLARPNIAKRNHILWAIFVPGFLLWLLIFVAVLGSTGPASGRWTVIGLTAITLPAISAAIGLPITYLLLKITKWFE